MTRELSHAAWLAEAPSPTGSSGRPWCYAEPQACHAALFLWLREFSGLRQLVAAGAESWGYCGASTQAAGGSDRRRVLPVSQRQDGICWLAFAPVTEALRDMSVVCPSCGLRRPALAGSCPSRAGSSKCSLPGEQAWESPTCRRRNFGNVPCSVSECKMIF